jgi:hypothetical protein
MYGSNESPKKYFKGVTKVLGCNKGTAEDMVECLRALPYRALMNQLEVR